MIEETQVAMAARLEALVKDLPPDECEKLLVEFAEYILMGRYGFVFDDNMREINPGGFRHSTTYQSFNEGKAILVSPKGYEVVSEENVGSNGCYRVTLRERKRSSFESAPREGNVPHLERGGFLKRYQGRKR